MSKPNWKNRTLFHGDNLEFLRAMNSHTVDLIATDPPFNKGRDFHATPDSLARGASFQDRWSWERDVHEAWVDKITDDFPKVMNVIEGSRESYGDNMGAFLCFMAVRLLEMHRVLREDGSIYLHCDPTASHYLKELMDAVFGRKQFRNEIVWCYSHGGKSRKSFGRKHDILFFYSKSNKYKFNPDSVRIPMRSGTKSFGGRLETDKDGRKYRLVYGTKTRQGETKYYKYYLDQGKIPEDYWTDINSLQSGVGERTGHPTQKPLALYERIVKASSNEGDVVFDPFAGCATTLVAAERLRRKWVGADIWKAAHEVVIDRLEKDGLLRAKGSRRRLLGDQSQLFAEDLHFTSELPIRNDDGDEAVPFLLVRERVKEPKDEYATNTARREFLLKQYGAKCQGCARVFDDPRYLELDHNTPRSDGGWNHISNRILLCGPCNKLKSNRYTLSGLRRENKKFGYLFRGG